MSVLRPCPVGFREVRVVAGDQGFVSLDGGLTVITSIDEINGAEWIHISVSRRSRMPTYEDLARVKSAFIGDAHPAYQVFPRKAEHRNLHSFCLHLWSPVGKDPFPDPLGERADTIAPAMEVT